MSRPRPMTTRWSAVSSQLAHQVAGDEHGPALGGERPQQAADPPDALRVEAVDRLVEQQHRRVAEQRAGDAEPLPHAEREAAGPPAGHGGEADRSSTSSTRRPGRPLLCAIQSRWLRALRPGWTAAASSSAPTSRSGARSDRYGRPPTSAVPASGASSPRIDPHRGRLAGAVRPDEAGDLARRTVKTARRRRPSPVALAQRPRTSMVGCPWSRDATEPPAAVVTPRSLFAAPCG